MVESNAAFCELTVDKNVWGKDLLMQWVCGLASDKQVSVKVVKKGSLGLKVGTSTYVLTERNAILRSLCGMALLNALDQSPVYLLGGCSESSHASSTNDSHCSLTMASIASWMSLASTVAVSTTTTTSKDVDGEKMTSLLLSHLNSHLSDKCFLVANTPQPTLADYDLAFALLSSNDNHDYPPHVHRWLSTTLGMAHNLNPQQIHLPTAPTAPTSTPLFLHFPGTPPTANSSAPAKGSNPPSQPQQEEQQQPPNPKKKELTEEEKKAVAEKRAQAKKEKKQKANNNNKQKQQPAAEEELTIAALDIRVGQIRKVWEHPEAEKLYCEEIDVGEQTVRNIASGLRPFYSLEEMTDRRVLVLCNLKKRNLLGFPSHGMVLCASNDDHTQVQFVVPPKDVPIGERVTFTSVNMVDAQPETKVHKKKILQQLAPDLKTDDKGMVIWKSSQHMATTSAGPCHAIQNMPNAHVS